MSLFELFAGLFNGLSMKSFGGGGGALANALWGGGGGGGGGIEAAGARIGLGLG